MTEKEQSKEILFTPQEKFVFFLTFCWTETSCCDGVIGVWKCKWIIELPCAVKIEGSWPPDGEEAENVLIEVDGFYNGVADEGDVVDGL